MDAGGGSLGDEISTVLVGTVGELVFREESTLVIRKVVREKHVCWCK